MKTFEQFENIDEKEKLFLELAHLDDLEIRFDFLELGEYMFYYYKEKCLFGQEKKNKKFYVSRYEIYRFFEKAFNFSHKEFDDYILNIIYKYFKLDDYYTIPHQEL